MPLIHTSFVCSKCSKMILKEDLEKKVFGIPPWAKPFSENLF